MSNKNCGPDVVKYFVVEPSGGGGSVTGATGDFYVCSGTTFVETISGCDDSVDLNGNTFYNSGEVFFNGIISACTGIHTSNIFGCSPITVHDEMIFLSGETITTIERDDTLTQILARDSVTGKVKYRDVISIITGATSQDTFVTGFTFNTSTYDLTIKQNEGQPDLVTNLASLATDVYVVSGVYNPSTGIVTYTNTSGGTFEVSGFTTGMTDSYTTDAYLSGTELRFDNNIQGINFYNVDLLPLLSGKTNVTTFNTYTANTQTILDGKIDSANNVGGANELFKDKSGTTLNFRTISGGSNTTVSTVGDLVKIDVSLPPSMNTYVTGGTYNPTTDTITLSRNDAVTIDITGVTDNFVVAGSYSDSTDIISLLRQDGSFVNITGVTDTFTTGATYDNETALATFNRNDGNSYTLDLSTIDVNDTFVTGFTYNDSNRFTISRNDGVNLSVSINTMTGLTVNGSVSATTYFGDGSNLTGISTDDNYVTGGTLNSGTLTLERQNGIVIITGFTTDLDTYVTGGTVSVSATDSDNSGTIGLFYKNSDGIPRTLPFEDTFTTGATYDNVNASVTFTKNDGTNYTLDLSSINVNDTFSTGGTVTQSPSSGSSEVIIQITGNDGFTPFNITGLTDTFVNDFSFSSNTFTISQNDGSTFDASVDSIDLASVLSAVTFDIATSGTISATTFNGGTFNGTFVGDGSGLTGITDNDTFVTGTTFSSNQATVTRNDGTDVLFLTGGTNVSLSNPSTNQIKIDVTIPADNNTFVTGFTYNNANTLTIERNDGVDLSTSINTMTGLTINGTLVVDTLSATTFTGLTLNDLDDVTINIPATPDNTYQGELLYFDAVTNQWVSGEEYGNLGEVTIWGKKGSAGTIDKGCPVYIVGFDDDIHEVELANATTATTMPVIGFTAEDFDNAGVYPIVTFGKISGLDTSSATTVVNPFGETWEVNDVLYMAKTDGGLTKFRPSGTNTQIQRIAKVLKIGTIDGQLFIFNTARTAGLPNLTKDYLWVGNGNDTPQEVIRTEVGITTTGFTYNDNNTFTITDDNGGSLSSTINQMSGLTINGDLNVTDDTTLNTLTATSITSNSAIDVFNGHINIRDNSYFLQGRTVADVNVSLIGVDNQDRVFVGNAGYDTYIDSDTIIDGVLSAQTAFLTTTPTLNNSATDILVRNSSTGEVEYRPVSGITPDTNTFVTGFTYNDANTFTISNNDGTSFNSSINIMTGFTVNNGVGDGFVTINSTSGQELEINQRGNNFNYSTPNIQVGTTGANMMIGSTGGIGSYPSGSYPGLNLNTTTGDIFLFNGGYGGTGAVMDFGGGNIRDIHDIQSSGNWPLKLYGGPGPNDANDGIQMYTADNLNVYTKKFEIKADTGTPDAYFTNINNFGVNTTTPQYTLDVNGTTRLLGLTANTLNLVTTPTLNNSATDILVRNSSTGEVEYRPVSGITPDTNTFVTGTTFSSNQATVTRNDGVDVLFLTGGTKISLSNPSTNQIKIDVSSSLNITTVSTTTYNATINDEIIGVDTSSNAVTIRLPDSVSSGTLRYEIKDIGFNSRSNPITIQAVGSDSIRTTSLVSSFTLSADGGAVVLINTATREWWQM